MLYYGGKREYYALSEFISSLSLALIIWFGGELSQKGIIGFGTLMMFIQYAQQFYEPIRSIAMIMSEFQMAQASAERIIHLLESEPTIVDTNDVIAKYGTVFNPIKENYENIKGDIEFKNVDFYYIKDEPILNNFNLKINAGETIALVGETGSGKSTIVNLLCRFYEPVNGELLIDELLNSDSYLKFAVISQVVSVIVGYFIFTLTRQRYQFIPLMMQNGSFRYEKIEKVAKSVFNEIKKPVRLANMKLLLFWVAGLLVGGVSLYIFDSYNVFNFDVSLLLSIFIFLFIGSFSISIKVIFKNNLFYEYILPGMEMAKEKIYQKQQE